MISQSSCYRKRLIPALLILAGLSGIPAFSEDAVKEGADTKIAPSAAPESAPAKAEEAAPVTAVKKAGVNGPPAPAAGEAEGSASVPSGKADVKSSEELTATDAKASETPAAEVKAAEKPAVETPAAVEMKAPVWHRMQMRLSGSMCYACLKDLEDALKKVHGINRVKIDKPKPTYYQPLSPDVSSWAEGVVIFDGEKIPPEYVRATIKKNGYHSYRVVDRLLDREPIDKDLKI